MNIKNKIIQDMGLGIEEYKLTVAPKRELGDYAFACFEKAKEQGVSPVLCAEKMANELTPKGIVSRIINVGPYVNFFVDPVLTSQFVINNIISEANYGSTDLGQGKVVCVDFSSINLAKYAHIGHLCTTIIGACIVRLLKYQGYKTISINYIGDYGTPFGKVMTAYKRWGNKEEVEKGGVDALQNLYIEFCRLEDDDESLLIEARNWFLKIENGDAEATSLYKWIIGLSLKELHTLYEKLGIDFDSWKGESCYSASMPFVLDKLNEKHLAVESEGAIVVDLEKWGFGKYLIQKSDGTSLYSTRDIAAAYDRYEMYKFDESLYVTDSSQNLHFKSLFKVLELLGNDWAKNCKHINYGRISTPQGKIASRRGKVAVLKDIFEAAVERASKVIADKNLPSDVAEKVGYGAVVYGLLRTERIKDSVFDLDNALRFDGETSVYLQYTNARINSIINKSSKKIQLEEINVRSICENLNNYDTEFPIIKLLDDFSSVLKSATIDYEPCYIARYIMLLATEFNKYYTVVKIIDEDNVKTMSRLVLCMLVQKVLQISLGILGIKLIDKM